MAAHPRKTGTVVALAYLLLTCVVGSPLVRDGSIGHGNGLEFLVTIALTAPLSVILLFLTSLLVDSTAFDMARWSYFLVLGELAAGALLNARLIHLLVERLAAIYHGEVEPPGERSRRPCRSRRGSRETSGASRPTRPFRDGVRA